MITKKYRSSEYYVFICNVCGREYETHKDSTITTCNSCISKVVIKKTKENLSFLIGAKITNVEPFDSGKWTNINEIETVEVETNAGKKIIFNSSFEDSHIEWK